ncbi:pyridoxamine 5'-phosphate oxidase family protein [Dehalogenimonas etheniformans]|uniref:Pyridoxamine 5'-phosphate oxidase family protein n=2 Tax=Dehalogenimonas etheniformans TaxID=1536648 RepID=A0A2P5P847_9CHLR|nr:pyridoxamine 5'-phosphate oxidase family protein [Dehalogenimonas etheniformans]
MVLRTSKGVAAVRNIIINQLFAVLTTTNANQPHCNLIAFVITDNLKTIVFATIRNTQKYINLVQNPLVSLLIDNRTNQPSDISNASAVTVFGLASEVSDEKARYADQLIQRYPRLAEFIKQADTAIVTISISHYLLSDFHNTKRIKVK